MSYFAKPHGARAGCCPYFLVNLAIHAADTRLAVDATSALLGSAVLAVKVACAPLAGVS